MNHEPEERYTEEIENIEESTDYIVLCEEHPEHDPERIRRQIELESLMRAEGLLRHQRKVEQARESERESATPYGRKLMREFITPLTQAVSREFETMKSGRPGCGNSGFKAILHLEPEVVAFLALRGLLNVISSANTFQYVAGEISGAIEDEARSRHFESCCREAYRFAKKRAEKSTTYHRKRKAINAMMLHTAEGAYGNDPNPMLCWESWSKEQKQNIGGKLIGVIIKALGIIELRKTKPKRRGQKGSIEVVAKPELKSWIAKCNEHTALLSPFSLPCAIPPAAYTTPYDGGYHTVQLPPVHLVKTSNKRHQALLEENTELMSVVYDAVGAAQNTPWRVNKRVLEVARQLWRENAAVAGLPNQNDAELPACPECGCPTPQAQRDHRCFADRDVLHRWKHLSQTVHEQNAKAVSKRLLVHRILWVADLLKDDPAFYYPYQMDFRGRFYTVPQFLNPQGCDLAKGLLEFAQGKPIETQDAEDWLAIHVANTRGKDKISFEERISWAHRHRRTLESIADDPIKNRIWMTTDNPFSFLAACIDWVNYKRTGRGYVSHTPVAQDGTCSGLQHYSAILRDPVAGAATNLLPSNAPKDIYKVVADRTLELLQAVPVGDEHYKRAQQWIASGLVTRKLTKQPVMTLPYGSTRYSSQRSILAYIDELRQENPTGVFFNPEEAAGACAYLNGVIHTAIEQTVLAAPKAMRWLQRVAEVASKAGRPLIWITPSGMSVVQEYFNQEYKRVTIKMTGESVLTLPPKSKEDGKEEDGGKKRIDVTVRYDGKGIDAEKQVQGIAPNFIHSMDASAMVLAIREAKKHGIGAFALIHDSFGTHAADSGCLADSLRKAFVDMYESLDVLEDFREEVASTLPEEARAALPEPPERGDLNLQSVKESKYFFA